MFSTKNRLPYITPAIEQDLFEYIGGIIRAQDGVSIEINGMPDHIHILAKLPPKHAVSDVLRKIKANSSKWVNESKPGVYKFGWQDGYSAFSVSKSQVDPVREYIRNQKQHHATRDFKSELRGCWRSTGWNSTSGTSGFDADGRWAGARHPWAGPRKCELLAGVLRLLRDSQTVAL